MEPVAATPGLVVGVLQSGLATAGMGVGIWLWLMLWPDGAPLWVVGVGIGLGALIYLGLTALLRMDELRLLRRVLRRG